MNLDFYTNVQRFGDNLMIRGIRDGKEVRFKEKYSPTIYLEHPSDEYGFKNLYGQPLKPVQFDTMKQLKEFKDSSGSNLKIYGYPHFHSQFTLENFVDSVNHFDKKHIRVFNLDIEVTSTAGFPEPKEAEFPVTAICIHDSVADKFVTFGIGDWDKEDSVLPEDVSDKVVYIPCKDERELFDKFGRYWTTFTPNILTGWNVETFDIPYIVNRMEKLGLEFRKLSPWGSVRIRDIPSTKGYEPQITADIMGVDIIDYLPVYKKNRIQDSYTLGNIASLELGEKKSLGTMEMLDISKVPFVEHLPNTMYEETDDIEFNRFAKIRNERAKLVIDRSEDTARIKELEKLERKAAFQAFISYNIQDVNLVKRIDEKMGLIDANIMIGYEACMNFQEVVSPVRTWDCLINKEMWLNRQIPHSDINNRDAGGSIPGGFVKEPHVGKHGWCASFDLNSLYPHLIMQFNISPETIDGDYRLWPYESEENRVKKFLSGEPFEHEGDYSVAASGYRFSNSEEGIIPRLMRKMYQDRKAFKKKMLEKQRNGEDDSLENLRQYVLKILLNSGYGALINKYFRWFDVRMGMSITLSGQYVIQVAEREINKWMNGVLKTDNVDYVIAIDTDSNYVNMQPLVDKFFPDKSKDELVDILDKIAFDQVQKVLDAGFLESKNYLNAYDQKMVMEREAIASSAFWTAKKRYAMCVWDMEGVRMPADKPKIKIQGLEAIRSSTPYVCRKPLLTAIEKVLLESEKDVQQYIKDFKDQFMDLPPEDIAMPRSMNNLGKYWGKDGFRSGTPPHARGAVLFNQTVDRLGLENIWEKIVSGEKGKFVWLYQPNPLGSDVLSFISTIPKEFEINKYINREKMFEKTTLDPMKNILEPLGWSAEERQTLEDFFG